MDKKTLTKSFLLAAAAGGIALSASAQTTSLVTGELVLSETFVESRSGGQNFAAYSEHGGGWPDSWANSSAKSEAPGLTAGIGSRFNSTAGFGGWFEVSPLLPEAGGVYDIYVSVTSGSGAITATADITATGGTGLPATTTAFSTAESADTWGYVGTLTLADGVETPTIRFAENTHSNRFYADGVAFVQAIPEPSTYAAIFGGLALAGAFVYRRRARATKA